MNPKILHQSVIALLLACATIPAAMASDYGASKTGKYTTTLVYQGGKPATDSMLFVYTVRRMHRISWKAYRPDKKGTVTFTCTAPQYCGTGGGEQPESSIVYATSPTGVGFCYYYDEEDEGPDTYLLPLTMMRVHVVDTRKRPVAHVPVCIESLFAPSGGRTWTEENWWDSGIPSPWTRTTDSKGWVTLSHLPQGYSPGLEIGGMRYVISRPEGLPDLKYAPHSPSVTMVVSHPNFVLGSAHYATGRPAVGVLIEAIASTEWNSLSTWEVATDARGRFTIGGLPPGSYYVALADTQTVDANSAAVPNLIMVKDGRPAYTAKLVLARGVLYTGRITNLHTGLPMASVDMEATSIASTGAADHKSTETGPDGRYSLRVPPGIISVWPQVSETSVPDIGKKHLGREGERRTLDFKISDGD